MSRANTNAKEEFLEQVKVTGSSVIAAEIAYNPSSLWESLEEETPPPTKNLLLKVGHSSEEYSEFLNELDFLYDSGYGGQELHGIIWLEDGTWCDRGEYDGSEWWEHNTVPNIPKYLL